MNSGLQDRDAAFVGVGRMGSRMARRLIDAGMRLRVFDPDPAAAAALVEAGAFAAASAAEAAAGVEFVLCSVPGPAQLESTGDAIAEGADEGTLVIDFSTGTPACSRKVAATCAARGIRFLDAPVSRGVAAATDGTLAILVGGAENDLADAAPLLDVLAGSIVHVGEVGSGQIAKLCNNMIGAINTTALGEVLAAGVRAGIELKPLTEAIRSSAGNSFVLEHYLPNTLFTQERPTTFALSLMRKDVGLFMQAGTEAGATVPVSALVQQIYNAAGAEGLDDADFTSVAELYERFGQLELRPQDDEGGAE